MTCATILPPVLASVSTKQSSLNIHGCCAYLRALIRFIAFQYNNNYNIIDDELLLNFSAKFQRKFVISHVKLQNCHDNPSVRLSGKMATKFLKCRE